MSRRGKAKVLLISIIVITTILPIETILASTVVDVSSYFYATQINSQKALVEDSKGRLHTVYMKTYSGRVHIYMASSNDDGATWVNITHVSNSAQTNSYSQSDPSIQVDSMDDDLHITWIGGHSSWTMGQIMYRRKIQSTGSWSSIIVVSQEHSVSHTNPDLYVTGGNTRIFFASIHSGTHYGIWSKWVYDDYSVSGWTLHSENLAGETFTSYHQEKPSVSRQHETSSWVLVWEGQSSLTSGRDCIFLEYSYDPDQDQITNEAYWAYKPSCIVDSEQNVHITYMSSYIGGTTNKQIFYQQRDWSGTWIILDSYYVSNYTGYNFNSYPQDAPNIGIDKYDRPYIAWFGKCTGYTANDVTFLRYREFGGTWSEITFIYTAGRSTYPQLMYTVNTYMDDETEVVFWEDQGTDQVRFEDFSITYPPNYPEWVNDTIYDSWGNNVTDNWWFKGEVYNITAYFNNSVHAYLNFTDGQHNIAFSYDNRTGTYDMRVITDDELVIGLISSTYNQYGTITRLSWGFILDINIVDSVDVSIDWYAENDVGFNNTGDTGRDVNIYNLGERTYYTFNGDGGHYTSGREFELYATNGSTNSYAIAQMIIRRLQSVNMLVEFDLDNEWDNVNKEFDLEFGAGYFDFGIDYRLNGAWVEGWRIRLYPVDGDVGHHAGGNDQDWIEWSVDYYNYNPVYGNVTNVYTDYIQSNHWGYDDVDAPEYSNRTSCQLHVALWFDKMNQSTVVAGRVNAYYHGMFEQGNPFWFGYGAFRPKVNRIIKSQYFGDLYDENGEITNCKKFDLMRLWCRVGTVNIADANDETWSITDYEVDWKIADDRMEGTIPPLYEETKTMEMPQHGVLARIQKAIEGLSTAIWKASFGFMKVVIGALDTFIVGFLHSPISMTQIINLLMIQASNLASWMNALLARISDMLSVITNMLSFVINTITYLTWSAVWLLVNCVALPIHVLRFMYAIISGNPYSLGGYTFNFTTYHEIIEAGIMLGQYFIGLGFLIWIVYGNPYMEGEEDIEGIPSRIVRAFGFMKEAYHNLYWVYNHIRNEIISLYNFIKSHIPFLSGGGGETTE